jgi:prepilin-type N-terminal cleavage/methylation domain-containing protein
MLAKLRKMKQDEGFTLVELLVVIAILGILAGIVVFSVAGITNNSQTSACSTEKSELATAEEAYFAGKNTYIGQTATAAAPDLVSAKLLQSAPSWYKVTVTGTGATATYAIALNGVTGNPCT